MRIILSLVILLSTATNIYARSISADIALERVLRQTGQHAPGAAIRYDAPARPTYSLAYSAPTGSYYVFNRSTGGYLVVSGDDQIYPVLADVTTGSFATEDLAPAAKLMLDGYDSQIQSFADDKTSDFGLMDYYNIWHEIAPLMTTQWNQQYPYNAYCPAIGGYTCVTGCVATAMAQVVRCIGYYKGSGYRSNSNVNSNGEKVEFDYASATFDFDNMFDTYPSAAATIESIDQVGQLMLACGLAVSMHYGISESGAQSANVARGLIEHFGYDSDYTQIYSREDFSQAQWENMLYRQLQNGRPVYYSGSGTTSGHAFVIDGYRPAGLYHVNWGWGGTSDGYYRLTALNPSQTGIGGGLGGFNIGGNMVCAVPPGAADPGVTYGELTGSIKSVAEGTYALYYRSICKNLFNTDIGAVIADLSGNNVATTTFWHNQNITAASALLHNSFNYDFSQIKLEQGDYRIYPAFRPDGGKYTITDRIIGRPHFINLTVTVDGEYIISNDPDGFAETDIHIAGIYPGYDLRQGFSGYVEFYAVNNGGIDYKDSFRITLLDENGKEIGSATSQTTTVAAGANAVINCPVPVFDNSGNLIQVGTYPVRFSDNEGNILSDGEFTIEIKNGTPLSVWTSEDNIEVTNYLSVPSTLFSGELWPHTPLIKTSQTHRSMSLRLAFYNPSGTSAVQTLLCFQGTIGPMEAMFHCDPVVTDVPFGIYEVCYRKGYSQISQRTPIRIGISVDSIGYLPAYDDGISATLMPQKRDFKEIVIPERVKVNDTDRVVTAIESEAFTMADSLSAVDLPSCIEQIGANAFTGCPNLRQIIIRSEVPPFSFRNHIAPGLKASTEVYVPASSYEDYKPLLEPYNPVYAIIESIESKEVTLSEPTATVSLAVYPAHEAINPAFVIIPADNAAGIAEVNIASAGPGALQLEVKARQKGTATFYIRPAHRSDNYAALTVIVPETTVIDELPAETDRHTEYVFDLLGRPVDADATTTSPQLRIVIDKDGKASKVLR